MGSFRLLQQSVVSRQAVCPLPPLILSIRAPDGKMWDITPSNVSQPYPFIHHPGTIEDFDDLRRRYQVMNLDHFVDVN